jgi:hypothetical protein
MARLLERVGNFLKGLKNPTNDDQIAWSRGHDLKR